MKQTRKLEQWCFFSLPFPMDVNAKGSLENNFYLHSTTRGRKCTFLFLSYASSLASDLFPQDFQLQNKHVFWANCINNPNFNSFSVVPFVIVPNLKKMYTKIITFLEPHPSHIVKDMLSQVYSNDFFHDSFHLWW